MLISLKQIFLEGEVDLIWSCNAVNSKYHAYLLIIFSAHRYQNGAHGLTRATVLAAQSGRMTCLLRVTHILRAARVLPFLAVQRPFCNIFRKMYRPDIEILLVNNSRILTDFADVAATFCVRTGNMPAFLLNSAVLDYHRWTSYRGSWVAYTGGSRLARAAQGRTCQAFPAHRRDQSQCGAAP